MSRSILILTPALRSTESHASCPGSGLLLNRTTALFHAREEELNSLIARDDTLRAPLISVFELILLPFALFIPLFVVPTGASSKRYLFGHCSALPSYLL
jgi:hypothetical protein